MWTKVQAADGSPLTAGIPQNRDIRPYGPNLPPSDAGIDTGGATSLPLEADP